MDVVSYSISPLPPCLCSLVFDESEKPALSENDFDSLSVSAQVFLEVPFPKVMNLSVPNDTIDVPMGDYGTADRPGLHIGAKFGQYPYLTSSSLYIFFDKWKV